jgi:hypothetical protein
MSTPEATAAALAEFRATPEQANQALADLTAAYRGPAPPATPTDAAGARARMAELAANPKWTSDYLNGNADARQEFSAVTALISTGNDVDMAMEGVLPEARVDFGPGASLRDQAAAVPVLREIGVGDDAIRQLLSDKPISRQEHQLAEQWRNMHFTDADWTKKYLAGDGEAVRQMTLCNIVLASEIDERK